MLPPFQAFSPDSTARRAFTLVEMLVVMVIIVVLVSVCTPVVTALKGAGDVSKTVYDLAGILEQARAYAMGKNTYVYVGLKEVDITQPSTGQGISGSGRLVAAVVSTKDGTQGYSSGSTASPESWAGAYSFFASDLVTVGKPLAFDNVHVPDLGAPPATGGMARPSLSAPVNSTMSYSLGNDHCVSATPFDYPIGASLGAGQYSFTKVIQFDPQGVARIQTASTPSAITTYLEIGLEQTHGTTVPVLPSSPTTGNVAALQVDGMTGAVRVYRP